MGNFKKFGDFVGEKAKLNDTGKMSLSNTPVEESKPIADNKTLVAKGEEGLGDNDEVLSPEQSGGKKPETNYLFVKSDKFKANENFIQEIKDLNPKQLCEYILDKRKINEGVQIPGIHDLLGNSFTPSSSEAIAFVSALITNNDNLMNEFVMSIKQNDGLQKLLNGIMFHKEGCEGLVDYIEDEHKGDERSGRIVGIMNNRLQNAINNFDFGEDETEFDFGDVAESTSMPLDDILMSPSLPEKKEPVEKDIPEKPEPNEQPTFMGKQPEKMKADKPRFKGRSAGFNLIKHMAKNKHFSDYMSKCKSC